jgi:CO/xanthine dehydrogenase FAD-binding subunit
MCPQNPFSYQQDRGPDSQGFRVPNYYRPDTLKDALGVLAETSAVVAAGCTDLFPATDRQALSSPVLDITAIGALRGITESSEGWRIGATTSWSDILRAPLPPAFDMLKQAAAEVGSVQIQTSGTVAGNLCNASPAADGVPPLLALDAQVELAGPEGTRTLPLADFLTGPRQTCRRTDELLSAVLIPASAVAGTSRFLKLGARKYLVISIAMVAVRRRVQNGCLADLALAVGACSAVATRLPALERTLTGRPIGDVNDILTDDAVAASLAPITDIRADAPYRAQAAAELLRRAFADLGAAP